MMDRSRPSLDDAFQRIEWARKSVAGLRDLERAFAASELGAASLRMNPEPNVPFVFGRPDNPIPPDIRKLSSETVGHLRSALDYLIFQLAWLDSGQIQEMTQFPIEHDAEKWSGRNRTYLRGVGDTHISALAAMQPFSGCAWTKTLQSLSNPDKHRQIIAANHNTAIETEVEALPGDVSGEVQFRVKLNLAIYIAFDDGSPVVDVLDSLVSEVSSAVAVFQDYFEGPGDD